MQVIVVGAGAAGLAATCALRRKGIRVTAIEAGSEAGGRCRSVVRDGYIFDLGALSPPPFTPRLCGS